MPRPRTPLKSAQISGALDHNPKRFADRIEATPRGPLGPAPMNFTPEQIEIWEGLIAVVPEGVLTAGDTYLVELAVLLIEKLRSRCILPVEIGHLRASLGSMGLTPADRSRVTGSNESPKKEDPLAVFEPGFGRAN